MISPFHGRSNAGSWASPDRSIGALHKSDDKLWTRNSADRDGRRIRPENLDFVRLPATVTGSIPAKRPGTAPFPPGAFMDPGSLESGWWSEGDSNPVPSCYNLAGFRIFSRILASEKPAIEAFFRLDLRAQGSGTVVRSRDGTGSALRPPGPGSYPCRARGWSSVSGRAPCAASHHPKPGRDMTLVRAGGGRRQYRPST